MAYGPDGFVEEAVDDLSRLPAFLEDWPVTWINVDGLRERSILLDLAGTFGLHTLAIADVANVTQRPKIEHYEKHDFLVLRMPQLSERLSTEQVSLFLGQRVVITFQERVGDCFDPVRKRIRESRGRIRSAGPDYLAYALLDAVVDSLFPVLEEYGERVDGLEDRATADVDSGVISDIHDVKRDLLTLRRAVWPLREAVNALMRDESPFIMKDTQVYMRDCYDHAVQVIDLVENYRELAAGLVELCMSNVSNRMNEIMKVLSIIATVFLPLGFIAGLYGMNFNSERSRWNMPELNWAWGYPFTLLLMAAVVGGMLLFFRSKGWLGGSPKPRRPDRDESRRDESEE
jgi:magnesium transporter